MDNILSKGIEILASLRVEIQWGGTGAFAGRPGVTVETADTIKSLLQREFTDEKLKRFRELSHLA
ncbi:MAG: hypothetical protein A4E58_01195 [Syntrophorhabdus sp. PtaB.Bin006]|nr:MAG: hypothetical protein A4E58_01195 [Syntrophorhabdus sp. PtaB.Bin006]